MELNLPEDQISVPTRNGTGLTIGTREVIEAEQRYVQSLLNSLVPARCSCNVWEILYPLHKGETCNRCGDRLKLIENR